MTSCVSQPGTTRTVDPVTVLALGVTVLAWASAFPAIRVGLDTFGPLQLGALRFAVAALPAAFFLAVTRPPLPRLNGGLAVSASAACSSWRSTRPC